MASLIAISLAFSTVAALILVPLVRAISRATGVVDRPDQQRKLQSKAIALGGGVAVYASLALAFAGTILVDRLYFGQSLGAISIRWYILFGAAAAMLLVGLIDDAWGLRGRQKLLLQCLIIACLVGGGTVIHRISLFGATVELGVFSFPLTMLWLLIAVNALNLIDGADGMATTAGLIICIGMGLSALFFNSMLSVVVGFALAGALFGFLCFNRPPASIYLGDAGSMMIGLFLGVLAIWSNFKESAVLASAPIAILAIPLFDSSAAILRRWLTGRSIYVTDRGHLHHLLQLKFGNRGMLLVVALMCGITTTMSVLSLYLHMPALAAVGVAIVIGALIYSRTFGHAEARLLVGRAANVVNSFAVNSARCETLKHQRRVPLQGNGDWETVWEPLVEFAKSHDLAKVKIDLNLAWLHEGYHANWQSVRLPEKAFQMTVSIPLFTHRSGSDQRPTQIGRLEVVALAEDVDAYQKISELSDQLADMTPEIDRIVSSLEQSQSPGSVTTGIDSPEALVPSDGTVPAELEATSSDLQKSSVPSS
ncbi:WecA-like glycosyltransferase [Rubripirellula lacrimiformis]|uniref:WecA-like glycosyltransferase n=1 Tax=Rubripirellula lacrimiformis TaxID=1930273 RepID=A0A517N7S8_9BACT|nr:MraY family glycosyltransferase [Rubripirellula lacrimiformis]QDT03197.1 WecA-like glycosyltransferase [Rubripirellula lacrimiformis]